MTPALEFHRSTVMARPDSTTALAVQCLGKAGNAGFGPKHKTRLFFSWTPVLIQIMECKLVSKVKRKVVSVPD
jgi:hypothetical protein